MRPRAAILGAISAGLGVLMHRPTYNALVIPQMLLYEVGWLPALLGGAAVWLGRNRRSRLGMALGVLGAVIGGMGAWLIASGRTAGPDEIETDDEAMWRD